MEMESYMRSPKRDPTSPSQTQWLHLAYWSDTLHSPATMVRTLGHAMPSNHVSSRGVQLQKDRLNCQ